MFAGLAMTEMAELLEEAAEARALAAELKDSASARDLLQYAAALEAHAASLRGQAGRSKFADLAYPSVARAERTTAPGRRVG